MIHDIIDIIPQKSFFVNASNLLSLSFNTIEIKIKKQRKNSVAFYVNLNSFYIHREFQLRRMLRVFPVVLHQNLHPQGELLKNP